MIRKGDSRFWLTRFYLCCSILATTTIGLMDPSGKHYESISTDGVGGAAAMSYLCGLALAGVLDTIGHDLIGLRQWIFITLRRFRFVWCMGIAVGMMALILPQIHWTGVEAVVVRYSLDACIAVTLAVLDLRTRR